MAHFSLQNKRGVHHNGLVRRRASIFSRLTTSLLALSSFLLGRADAHYFKKLFQTHETRIPAEAQGNIGPNLTRLLAGAFMDR
jgi:hypothetical protein